MTGLLEVLQAYKYEIEHWGRISPFLFAGCLASGFLFVLCGAAIWFNWGSWQMGFTVFSAAFLVMFAVLGTGSLICYRIENLEIVFTQTEEGEL